MLIRGLKSNGRKKRNTKWGQILQSYIQPNQKIQMTIQIVTFFARKKTVTLNDICLWH